MVKLSALWWGYRQDDTEFTQDLLQAGETLSDYLEKLGVPKGVNSKEMIEVFRTSPLFTTPVSVLGPEITDPKFKTFFTQSKVPISLGALVTIPDMKRVSPDGRYVDKQPSYFLMLLRKMSGNERLTTQNAKEIVGRALKTLDLKLNMSAEEIQQWNPEKLTALLQKTEVPRSAPAPSGPAPLLAGPASVALLPPAPATAIGVPAPAHSTGVALQTRGALDWMQDLPTKLSGYERGTDYHPYDVVHETDIAYVAATFRDLTHETITMGDGVEVIQERRAPDSGKPAVSGARDIEFETVGENAAENAGGGAARKEKTGDGRADFVRGQQNILRHREIRDIGYVYGFVNANDASAFATKLQQECRLDFPPAIRPLENGGVRLLVPKTMINILADRYATTAQDPPAGRTPSLPGSR